MHNCHKFLAFLVLASLFSASQPVTGEVVDAASNGFSLRTTVEISAEPVEVYDTLVNKIAHWWDSAHTFSGNSLNLSITDEPNGCFCESFEPAGGVRHGTVVFSSKGKYLRLSGGLGPLQELAVAGTMSYELHPVQGRTKVTMTYRVGGYHPDGLDSLATAVDAVLRAQLERLEMYIEKGEPDPE